MTEKTPDKPPPKPDVIKTDTIAIPLKNREGKTVGHAQYAKVATRIREFHDREKACSITTRVRFKEGWVMFRAVVTSERGTFTGHSVGKASADKSFEKLETVAVGRALAMAGYLASGEIASFEEMQSWSAREQQDATLTELIRRPAAGESA